MKKIAGLVLFGIVLLNSFRAEAQTYAESALLFSRTNPGGSARIQAMGGAQVSLGGDFSSAQSNPAGLGMFNRSEFTISPGFLNSQTSTGYLNNATKDAQSKIIIPALSLAFQKSFDNAGKIVSGTFGLSVNRTNNFNRSFTYDAPNAPNSIIDYFISDANNPGGRESELFSSDGFLYNTPTYLAWTQYVINPIAPDSIQYTSDVIGNPSRQHERVQTSGSQYQVNAAYGVNVADVFYFGGGLGIATARYKSTKTFQETFTGEPLSTLRLAEVLNSSATGINGSLGIIVKPVPFFQLGLSGTTPTYYSFSDTYSAGISTAWSAFPYTGDDPTPVSTGDVLTNYTLSTPWKLNAGVAFFIKKYGFITADIEQLNYSKTKYHSKTDYVNFSGDNIDIQNTYRSVVNIRLGAEGRINNFRVRAGYNFMPDPYVTTFENNLGSSRVMNQIQTYSVGGGYRTSSFYVDVAYLISTQDNMRYLPYSIASPTTPVVTVNNTVNTFMVTVGFPFTR